MRVLWAALAVAASLALAGCSSSEPQSPVDPEKAESKDYVAPSIAFGVLATLGLVLFALLLGVRRRRRDRPSREGQPPAPKAPRGP